MQKTKIIRRNLSAVFLLNKPIGLSSNAALQKVRYLFRAEKAGHTGALDPLASGLLPICMGEATKFSHYLLDAPKRYITTVQLGITTTTGDAEGEVLLTRAIPELSEAVIVAVLQGFMGPQLQVPPMYSALKRDGKALYDLARQGISIERQARPIEIFALQLLSFNATQITLDVHCSKGTYIRVLGEDIAEKLGCGGHLSALHRTHTGHFQLLEQHSLEYLAALTEAERDALLLPVHAPVAHLPQIQVPDGREANFLHGQESNIDAPAMPEVLVFSGSRCLGLAQINAHKRLVPKRILNL